MDKSKLLEGLKKIKEAFVSVEQKFVDAKLNDGVTVIRYDGDKLDIGVPVNVVTEQGVMAIPDGDYSLEDGTTFTIAGGVVSAVTPMEAAPEDMNNDAEVKAAPAAAQPMTEATPKSIIESIIKESRFATEDFVTEKLAEITTVKETFEAKKAIELVDVAELKATVTKQAETLKAMFSILEEMAGEPSAAPTEKKNKPFSASEFKKEYRANLAKLQTED